MADTLLLISEKPDDLAFAQEVATAAELALVHVKVPRDGAKVIAADEIPVIMVDADSDTLYQEFETTIQETVGIFSDKINSNYIHFLSSKDLEEVEYLIQSPLFGNYVKRNFGDVKDVGEHYGRLIKASLGPRAFGLENLLKPGTKVQVIQLASSSQKYNAVEAVKAYLLAAKFQTRMATVVANAVDEILMNAMFDAPTDDQGHPILTSTPRSTVLKLEGKNTVEMHVGFDGKYVGISAIDYFGSLDKSKLLSHISKIYVKEEYKVRANQAGAGIGLATVFRSGGSFLFISESHQQTEVVVFFKKSESFRDFKDQFRFIATQFYQ